MLNLQGLLVGSNGQEKIISEIVLFQNAEGKTNVNVQLDGDTVWLTQKQMSALFDVSVPTINWHLKNIYEQGEVVREAVIRESLTTALDGKNYNTQFYNLDAIIAVGYRVNSYQATQFRIWATQTLNDHL